VADCCLRVEFLRTWVELLSSCFSYGTDSWNGAMTREAQAVLAEALRLDVPSRAQLAAELLGSLDGPTDPNADAAWAAEIERRVTAIEAGTVKLEGWADVRDRIEREILNR